jgi:hypothetical protein
VNLAAVDSNPFEGYLRFWSTAIGVFKTEDGNENKIRQSLTID